MNDKQQYRVKPGFTHGQFNQHKAGDIVELTEAEAKGFLDKLELVVEESKPVVEIDPEIAAILEKPIDEIKALEFDKDQWLALKSAEELGKNRSGLLDFIDKQAG